MKKSTKECIRFLFFAILSSAISYINFLKGNTTPSLIFGVVTGINIALTIYYGIKSFGEKE
ncbi:hypothetical protein [Clostridium fallax]|uniref:Uncharacterized protein n=1 Tax=Clostridium fallax TaxID=1533 RepID=A0A1M4SGD9_9CLOT|nr:hypothetical protein [Clostridium fallax]SHE31259.1 hypothetical protein SAMN05443638_10116 [Clostridium fallax]SQB07818.1 Uncharacterised protein [Clostridium fallax]